MSIVIFKMISSDTLQDYLESNYNYNIVGIIDLDWLMQQPRKTLYTFFDSWHRPTFDDNQRIVLFSRESLDEDTLMHIQKCASLIDISNFFILLCAPKFDLDLLDQIRIKYSYDDCVFSTLQVNFSDANNFKDPKNPFINLPETFCFSPWAHLEISSQGQFKPCCVYKESIKDVDGRPFHIQTDTVETVYHSQYLTDLRQQFLQGQRPPGCSTCWFKERNNGNSNRQWLSTYLGLHAQTLLVESDSIGNLVSLDIKLGNLCNFKCRICAPTNSSKIAEEHLKYFNTQLDLKSLNQLGRWAEDSKIWKLLNQFGKQLINIDFYGGEPFLIKQHESFIDYLIEQGHAHKIRLHYNTNGSVFPDHLIPKWKKFKKIDIGFSIDNIGNMFELERCGGNWQQVTQNLEMFFQHRLPNMTLAVFATVSMLNVYYLEDLIDWVETKEFDALHFNLLDKPDMFNITKMGKELSGLVLNRLRQIEPRKISQYNIERFIELIVQHQHAPHMVDQLRPYMLKLDTIRNQNFQHTHPEIAAIIYKGN